ncbi:MAG TPA: PHB depolymerase family esterase [Casimicrobiaceae bacterium]|nr:PHB depolymerase family esterase [Casimicrobiaceae bacterium]
MSDLNQVMREAMQLMRRGDLHAATRAIQRGLAADAPNVARDTAAGASSSWIDADYAELRDERETPSEPAPSSPHETVEGTFTTHAFQCEAGAMEYKLFVPANIGPGAPLLVMLHGCTQSPDDFARGTRMNALAGERGYVVAYPAQPQSRNAQKCWNWFRSDDQQRGSGEPAMIAALTRHLVQKHALDARRVYATGLSAGGAMAAVLGATYPDVYAAIGVHSGLPFGVASDLPSAFAAMRQGGGTGSMIMDAVPAVVFHGDRDVTVDPCNGAAVIEQFMSNHGCAHDRTPAAVQRTVEQGSVPGGRSYTRTVYRSEDGLVIAEHWEVHCAGHAWFGGDPSGSYTDPAGPDASEHMLRFFDGCTRSCVN